MSKIGKMNDPEIRRALYEYFFSKHIDKDEIFEELHVCNGRAIADIVTLNDGMHCYEIKGDADRIERVIEQDEYYKKSFRLLSLVTTQRHLEKALKILPTHWGIIVVRCNNLGSIEVRDIRKAKINYSFDKESALMILRKNEMIELLPFRDKIIERNSRKALASLLAKNKKENQVNKEIGNSLTERKNFKFLY